VLDAVGGTIGGQALDAAVDGSGRNGAYGFTSGVWTTIATQQLSGRGLTVRGDWTSHSQSLRPGSPPTPNRRWKPLAPGTSCHTSSPLTRWKTPPRRTPIWSNAAP
jgi:hypothetical protein